MRPFSNPEVARVFEECPDEVRRDMLQLRELIFDTAAGTEGVGELEETLKWGEPAYLTTASRSGTTVRIAWKDKHPDRYAMYFHCQTTLVDTFRLWFGDALEFEGNRAIVFRRGRSLPLEALALCISEALTYHRTKRAGRPSKRGG